MGDGCSRRDGNLANETPPVASDFTYDGNIATGQNDYPGDYEAGYGGEWDFHDFDSEVRLGEDSVTAVAVYATWLPGDPQNKLAEEGWGVGVNWETDAVYKVYDGSTLLATVSVNQRQQPGNPANANGDSPEPGDRPWQLLGVYNVNVGDTLSVTLGYDTPTGAIGGNADGMLCVSDVMIHPLWASAFIHPAGIAVDPNVSAVAGTNSKDPETPAQEYADWYGSWNPAVIAPEGDGDRTEFEEVAYVDPLFSQAPSYDDQPWTWTTAMPPAPGVNYYADATSGTVWQGNQLYPGTACISDVWASTNPTSPPADTFSVTFAASAPPGSGDATTSDSTKGAAVNAPQPTDADTPVIMGNEIFFAGVNQKFPQEVAQAAWPNQGTYKGPGLQGMELRVVSIVRVDKPEPRQSTAYFTLLINGQPTKAYTVKLAWCAWFKVTFYWRVQITDKNTGQVLGWAASKPETHMTNGHTPYSTAFENAVNDAITQAKKDNPGAVVTFGRGTVMSADITKRLTPGSMPTLTWDQQQKFGGCDRKTDVVTRTW